MIPAASVTPAGPVPPAAPVTRAAPASRPPATRAAAATEVVVVGNGMAGSRVVEEIRRRDPAGRVRLTVFGAERHAAYNRVLLSSVLAGRVGVDDIGLATPAGYAAAGIRLHAGSPVVAVDRTRRRVLAADGTAARYDALVLATGSRPRIPPLPGLRAAGCGGGLVPGAIAFRTVDDCRAIVAAARTARRVVVLGGGLLGLETARGLAERGVDVELLHGAEHLMERQLDARAARVLRRTVERLGVRVRLDSRAVAVLTGPAGDPRPGAPADDASSWPSGRAATDRVRGVRLATGAEVPAELLVLACGVQPEVSLAAAAGLPVEHGIVVDDGLRSVADPAVFAVGECAQHAGRVYGLVAPAWEQAAVVADRVTGTDPQARYRGSRLVTRLKAAGVDLAVLGDVHVAEDGAGGPDEAEVVWFADPTRGTYKKVVIRDERLVGAILLGDTTTVGTVTQLFDRGAPVPADRLALLFDGRRTAGAEPVASPAHLPDRSVICRCNTVTKGAITACWLGGARDVPAVAAATRATTGCGSCADTVAAIVGWLAAADPEPDPGLDPAPAIPAIPAVPA